MVKKILISSSLGFILVFSFYSSAMAIGLPFGGPILTVFPCVNGLLLTVGPPVGGSFMYGPGSVSYLSGPPTHSGQYLLGVAGPVVVCMVPCHVGLCPAGAGATILFHGSSL